MSTFEDQDFVSYLKTFSFVTLCETFVECVDMSYCFPNFDCYVSPARKLSQRGRSSGGIVCLVDRKFAKYFRRVLYNYDNVIVFKVCKTLFNTDKDVLMFNVYIPPCGSPYYAHKDDDNGVDMLQTCIAEMLDRYGECSILLNGDLNARTGGLNTTTMTTYMIVDQRYLTAAEILMTV